MAPDIPNPLHGKHEVSGYCVVWFGCLEGSDPIVEAYVVRPPVADALPWDPLIIHQCLNGGTKSIGGRTGIGPDDFGCRVDPLLNWQGAKIVTLDQW